LGCIVTGDFTTQGDWGDERRVQILQEFEALRKVLGLKREQIIAVPGNHDIERYPPGASSVDLPGIIMNNQTSYKHELSSERL
jgi:3',5'-cyclic AMP phosphodiesterase CpdA